MVLKSTKWIDAVSLVLTCFLITIGIEKIKVSGETNYQQVFIQFAVMIFSYLTALFLFVGKNRLFGIPSIVLVILLGTIFWLIGDSVLGIYYDWRYISSPGAKSIFYRHLLLFKYSIIFILFFDIFALVSISVVRTIARTFFKIEFPLQ